MKALLVGIGLLLYWSVCFGIPAAIVTGLAVGAAYSPTAAIIMAALAVLGAAVALGFYLDD